jgi:glycosyltransferase involved in cell wall biosynthesis
MAPRFALNVVVSGRDGEYLQQLAPLAKTLVVPNGVDLERLRPRRGISRVPSRIVFLGPLYVFANREAIDYFIANAWRTIRSQIPDASFRIVGECTPELRSRLEITPGVQCAGYVEDLSAELWAAQCAVVPLRLGGGTRLKIVDAWAAGLPVVSTTIGAEGLDAVDGRNILIADTPDMFAAAVTSVLQDEELRNSLAESGQRTAAQYDWAAIGTALRDAYSRLILESTRA